MYPRRCLVLSWCILLDVRKIKQKTLSCHTRKLADECKIFIRGRVDTIATAILKVHSIRLASGMVIMLGMRTENRVGLSG